MVSVLAALAVAVLAANVCAVQLQQLAAAAAAAVSAQQQLLLSATAAAEDAADAVSVTAAVPTAAAAAAAAADLPDSVELKENNTRMYEECPESKDTKVLNMYNIFNLQKQHCE